MMSSTSIKEDLENLIKNNIIITIGSKDCAEIVSKISNEKKIRAHIKIDTGFGRYGFLYNNIKEIIDTINNLSNVKIEGIYSHFSLAYYENNKWTKKQFRKIYRCITGIKIK